MDNKIMYRVQGANLGYPSVVLSDFYKIRDDKTHLFISRTLTHHEYYINKRIKQIIKNLLVIDGRADITDDVVKQVCESLSRCNFEPLNLIEFEVMEIMQRLLEENSLVPKQFHKKKKLMPKKVDEKRLGGGFHLTQLWLKLFCDSLVCIKYSNVDSQDILQFTESFIGEDLHGFGQIDYAPIRLQIKKCIAQNPVFSSEYGLDIILGDLRAILREGAFVEGSSLDEAPERVVDNFMSCAEDAKVKVLRMTDGRQR